MLEASALHVKSSSGEPSGLRGGTVSGESAAMVPGHVDGGKHLQLASSLLSGAWRLEEGAVAASLLWT